MADQADSELGEFWAFVAAAQLAVVPDAVVKRTPPEPDILCRLQNGEAVAFELVEICNSRNARFMGSATHKHELIVAAYEGLTDQDREVFDRRFVDVPLSFYFRRETSVTAIRQVLPGLLTELASMRSRSDEYTAFSARVAEAVVSVRERGRLNAPGEVNFNIGGEYDPTVPIEGLAAKLEKKYETDYPIELLAHFGPLAWGHDRSYREAFLALLGQKGLGPFRRVWVKDWQGIGLVMPEVPQ